MHLIKKRKAQSAMEYLMTYGWAILIILIALGALFYLGVFRPKTGNMCQASPPIQCTDVKLEEDGTFTMVLGSIGTALTTVDSITFTSPVAIGPVSVSLSVDETPSAKTASVWSGDQYAGRKFAGSATATVQLEGSSITHTKEIHFTGTVE